ncbi:MAG: response regulator transcription factor [Pseudomonadota bacterium]
MKRRMLVVEDHPLVAEYTCALFRDLVADVEVVHAGTAPQALQALTEQTDWFRVWLDVDVPGARGLSLVREVHAMGLAGRSAVITANLGLQWQAEVAELGFLGYVPKAMSVDRFKHAIQEIIEGRRYFAETQRSERPIRLTRRQIEILNLLPAGGGTKEIAKQLKLTAGTVDNHVAAILFALRARSRTHAVAIGIEHGYIEPSVLSECTAMGGH